jgi:hypothetical protein
MKRRVAKTNGWVLGLMLLSAILLFAAPAMPAAAATPKGDCCAEMSCHDQSKTASCPDACVLACHVVVAPETSIVGSAEIGSAPIALMSSLPPPGRTSAPELPPPR